MSSVQYSEENVSYVSLHKETSRNIIHGQMGGNLRIKKACGRRFFVKVENIHKPFSLILLRSLWNKSVN